MDETDRDGVQEMEFLAAGAFGDDEVRGLEDPEVFHDAEPGHGEPSPEGIERLAVLFVERVEEFAPRGVGERFEHGVHGIHRRNNR